MRIILVALLLLILPLPPAAEAQQRVALSIELPEAELIAERPPFVAARGLLAGNEEESLIRNGFSTRLLFIAELWPTGIFRSPIDQETWDVVVEFEPLGEIFRVARRTDHDGWHPLGEFKRFSEVQALLERPYQPAIQTPTGSGRFYYSLSLEVERITANDLEELRSWMGPAKSAGSAFMRGLGSLFTRLLGAQKRRYQTKTGVFRVQ